MSERAQRQSAQIYQFPAGGRAGLEAERDAWRKAADTSVPLAHVAFGGSWYHEEAVETADRRDSAS